MGINIFKTGRTKCLAAAGLVLATALFMAGILAAPSVSWAQAGGKPSGKVRATHGAWQLVCGKPAGAKSEKCAILQSVTDSDRPNVGLAVIMMKSRDAKSRLLRVVAPLGVLLTKKLQLNIDNAAVKSWPFIKCGRMGCIAETVVKDELVTKLKSGKSAMFIIYQTPESGIGIPISLNGFARAIKELK